MKRYFCSWFLAAALTSAAGLASAKSANGRQVHVVYEGQRLGSIAKRYNVSIEAICEANGIRRKDPIHPGQRLEIPSREELAKKAKDEKAAVEKVKATEPASPEAAKASVTPEPTSKSMPKSKAPEPTPGGRKNVPEPSVPAAKAAPREDAKASREATDDAANPAVAAALFTGLSHRVEKGDSLIAIARQYDTNVKTLLQVNHLRRDQIIRVGQVLTVPRPAANSSWVRYARSPGRPGEMEVYAHTHRWKGKVIAKGKVQSTGRAALSGLLGATGSAPPLPERLIQLLAHVSDTFGGRPIRLVSGYRTSSYFKDSRHKHSSAIDFSIDGVPNSAVRDYLLQLSNVGVGYYPNSSFVHLDVRGRSAYWVDYAGPGEAPRRKPRGDTRIATNNRKTKRRVTAKPALRRTTTKNAPTLRELDALAEQAVQNIEAGTSESLTQTAAVSRKDRGG